MINYLSQINDLINEKKFDLASHIEIKNNQIRNIFYEAICHNLAKLAFLIYE